MKSIQLLILALVITINTDAQSFLARITGINVDLNQGTVSVKPPEINAIPQMIKTCRKM